jgi:MurNAc alpha-1-phosphate uridylyltransferase
VLAAGYGTRLAPLTDRTPKPLVPVAGRPMIGYALDKLRAYGIGQIVINVSHLKEQLTDYFDAQKTGAPVSDPACLENQPLRAGSETGAPILRNFPVVKISEEMEPLETGGGLKQAAPLLGRNRSLSTIATSSGRTKYLRPREREKVAAGRMRGVGWKRR